MHDLICDVINYGVRSCDMGKRSVWYNRSGKSEKWQKHWKTRKRFIKDGFGVE